MSTTKENKYRFKPGDLVKVPRGVTIYRPGDGLALVIEEKHPVTKRYRIMWCQSGGKTTWVREDNLTPAY